MCFDPGFAAAPFQEWLRSVHIQAIRIYPGAPGENGNYRWLVWSYNQVQSGPNTEQSLVKNLDTEEAGSTVSAEKNGIDV